MLWRVELVSLKHNTIWHNIVYSIRPDSRFAPSQWETPSLCNDVSHLLGASLESALSMTVMKVEDLPIAHNSFFVRHLRVFRGNRPPLTHWGRVTHICVSKLTIIGSDNDLSPSQCQAKFWTNAGILSIQTLATNFSEILSEIHTFSLKKCISKCCLPNGGNFVWASMC